MMRKIAKDVIGSLDKGKNKVKGAYLAGFAMPHDSPEQLMAHGSYGVRHVRWTWLCFEAPPSRMSRSSR